MDTAPEPAGIAALAAEMAVHGTDREAPVRAVMALLGDRWSTLIILVLATGEWRHADLRRVMARLSKQIISQRVLTLKLRALERDGFVQRSVSRHVPPKVSYRLTSLGKQLFREARGLIDWVVSHEQPILKSRMVYDAREE